MSCDARRSLIRHPDAILFSRIRVKEFFQQPRCLHHRSFRRPNGGRTVSNSVTCHSFKSRDAPALFECPSRGQVSGQFYVEKSASPEVNQFFCISRSPTTERKPKIYIKLIPILLLGLSVSVSSDPTPKSSCAPGGIAEAVCLPTWSCNPQETRRALALNVEHEIDKAGEYSVTLCVRFHTLTRIWIISRLTRRPSKCVRRSIFASSKRTFRFERISILGQSAPINRPDQATGSCACPGQCCTQSLEDTLLTFADNADIRPFAPLASIA